LKVEKKNVVLGLLSHPLFKRLSHWVSLSATSEWLT